MKIQTFIFNWRGQYEKTKEKEAQFKAIGVKPIIINSDDNHREEGWHNIGEESYFTAQYLKAVELFDGDALFHIQADASYNDWAPIYEAAKKFHEKYNWGIYAPNVDYTWYDSSRADLKEFEFDEDHLKMVMNTDCTCWMVHKDIIEEAKNRGVDFSPYKMGWSFDIIYTALSFMKRRPVIRDYNFTIDHPMGTNYNKDVAEKEMHDLFNSLPEDIKLAFYAIKQQPNYLYNYYAL